MFSPTPRSDLFTAVLLILLAFIGVYCFRHAFTVLIAIADSMLLYKL